MNIQLADSLEEFDLRYIESCNQCFSSGCKDEGQVVDEDQDTVGFSGPLASRSNSIASKTNKLTLSSPLLDNNEFGGSRKSDFSIYDDERLKMINNKPLVSDPPALVTNAHDFEHEASAKLGPSFRRPPLKPSLTSGSINYKKGCRNNLGNPFYKPPSIGSANSVMTINDLESPSKKRKVSLNHSVSSFESLLSLHNKQQEFHPDEPQISSHSMNQGQTFPSLIHGSKDQSISRTHSASESSFNGTDDDNDTHYNYYNENNDIPL